MTSHRTPKPWSGSVHAVSILGRWACALAAIAASGAAAQIADPLDIKPQLAPLQLEQIDGPTRAQLQATQLLLQQHDFDAAVDSLRNLSDRAGGQLISVGAVSGPYERFVPLIDYLHGVLCSLPEDQTAALTAYRQRVDDAARTMYEQGLQEHDETLLARVVREFFASRWGDNAALALGDLALERGDYEMACSYWRRLHPQLAAEFHASLSDVEVPGADVQASSAATRPERFPIVYPDAEISLPELAHA